MDSRFKVESIKNICHGLSQSVIADHVILVYIFRAGDKNGAVEMKIVQFRGGRDQCKWGNDGARIHTSTQDMRW